MSVPQLSVRKKCRKRGKAPRLEWDMESEERAKKGDVREIYHHTVTQAAVDVLAERKSAVEEIESKSGTRVQLTRGSRVVIIQGFRTQIEEAVQLINEQTDVEGTLTKQAQKFWLQWVQEAFPKLDSCTYFLPSVFFKRVPTTNELIAGQNVSVILEPYGQAGTQVSGSSPGTGKTIQDCQVREDASVERVLFCLQEMARKTNEVFVGLSNFQFRDYLGEPCYAAATAHLPTWPKDRKRGDFDVLLIHRHYGFVVCEVKAIGDNFKQLNLSQEEKDSKIRGKLAKAVLQLDKAEDMLSHVSNIAPGLRIAKTIAVPNLTSHEVEKAISGDHLTEDLRRCLGTTDSESISGHLLCSDCLSDPETPWDVSEDVLKELENWWQRRVVGPGADSHMTSDVYMTLVSRFCGPATTVNIRCTSPPRCCVRTLDRAVSLTGECYTSQITLLPYQFDLINSAPSKVILAGPPGTGKSIVLQLMATEWLRRGSDVYILSTCGSSRASCIMLHYVLQQTPDVTPTQLHLLHYDLSTSGQMEAAVNNLAQASLARRGMIHVIADEAGPDVIRFEMFCNKLVTRTLELHLWAASCYHGHAPIGWQQEYFTRSLRSPPVVVRELVSHWRKTRDPHVDVYVSSGSPVLADGPPVKRVFHGGKNHAGSIGACSRCGREVAYILRHLNVGDLGCSEFGTDTVPSSSPCSPPPCLQYRDVLVLYFGDDGDYLGVLKGLRDASVPVMVMMDADIDDVATARRDVVWAANGDRVRGLERKVVVCLGDDDYPLHILSRCSSQLVVVSRWEHQKV